MLETKVITPISNEELIALKNRIELGTTANVDINSNGISITLINKNGKDNYTNILLTSLVTENESSPKTVGIKVGSGSK